jgi:hypothetical protein
VPNPVDGVAPSQASLPPAPGAADLKITKMETIPVRAPLAREFRGSYYHMTHRATLVARIHTGDGGGGGGLRRR